jgi:quercetin dioxygenase-like cupin family protein
MKNSMQWLSFLMIILYSSHLFAQSAPQAGINRKTLLQQQLPPTSVEEVRIDEITCAPGQGAPDHYHPCEVYGYVIEGQIIYQVYGQAPVLLRSGDSFREAAGQRIMVFRNALADKPSKFIAVYLAKKDQPVIVLTNNHKNE